MFEPFAKADPRYTRPDVSPPQVSPSKPPSDGKPPETYSGQTKQSHNPEDVSEASRQVPAYTSAVAAPPPTPLSHSIQPHHSNPLPSSGGSVSDSQIPPGQIPQPVSSPDEIRDSLKVASGPMDVRNQGRDPKIALTISPTATWTNPPDSQIPPQLEGPMGDMAVDLEGTEENGKVGNNEDCEMPPARLDCCVTPDSKGIHTGRNSASSQKDPPPTRKLCCSQQITPLNDDELHKSLPSPGHGAKAECKQLQPNLHPPSSPDPISPVSPQQDDATPKDDGAIRQANSDPITVTPSSQRNRKLNDIPPYTSVIAPKTYIPEEKHGREVAANSADPPPAKPKSGRTKPSCPPSSRKDKDEPHIHAVLKRCSTLPANDNTQICIDITGDKDGIEQDGIPHSNKDGSDVDNSPQTQFTSIAPFLNACEKWFPTFDPNLQKVLANKAQQAAINCQHFSSMNAALYLLSRGPWIPTHISVHVRQAALAAVGVGWSWVNQVPTTFPFSQYDACVSIATIDNIPANHVTKVDALFVLYATLCGNLSQMTRKFLFSKYQIRCSCCTQKFEVPVDLFCATVSSTTTIEMLANLLTPTWNSEEIQERQTCRCLELDKATWKCLKLGPLSLIRLEAAQGERLPRVEDALLVLGHQFAFQARDYEVHCLITTNRLDQDSQLIILHSNQPGMVATYDHNNGLRIVETERVNSKLIIVGVLALPVKSQKAILTTKELVTVAGAVEPTRYYKKHLSCKRYT